jgi:predicted secreted protein
MEISRVFLLIVIMLLSLAGTASPGGPAIAAVVITKEDNGKTITVPEGATFEVRLQQHGGTGYLWQIVDPDETHLKVLESYKTPLREPPIVGGPLLITWKIRALKAGQTNLRILLYRPWEGVEKAADSFQVRIRIG